MIFFCAVLMILCMAYGMALLWLAGGLRSGRRAQLSHLQSLHPENLPAVTIVVCARNEEKNLRDLLPALARQNYPTTKLEIFLVDDRSTDGTAELCLAFAAQHPVARYFRVDDTLPDFAPKKRAIDLAVRHARGEIILLTDADGSPGENWAQAMARPLRGQAAIACGYSPYHPRTTLWQKSLALEYFSHAAVAAGSIGAGRPLTCTGSNLAYRREAFFAVNGFEGIAHWISGDDDLLLHKMHAQLAGGIVYVADTAAHVPVKPPARWRDFHAQRTRYASKGRIYRWQVVLALAGVYLLNLLLCLGAMAILWGRFSVFAFTLFCGALKAVCEYAYLRQAAAWFEEKSLLPSFGLAALFHPFYLVYFSTRAQFAEFSWRGERYAARTSDAPNH